MITQTNQKRWLKIKAICVIGNCLTPPTITEKKWTKGVEMYLINHDMH